jgi:hypothetical protein
MPVLEQAPIMHHPTFGPWSGSGLREDSLDSLHHLCLRRQCLRRLYRPKAINILLALRERSVVIYSVTDIAIGRDPVHIFTLTRLAVQAHFGNRCCKLSGMITTYPLPFTTDTC